MTLRRQSPAASLRSRGTRTAAWVACAAALAACGGAAPSVTDILGRACGETRDHLASVPAPADPGSEAAFIQAAHEATSTVARAAGDVAARGDDQTIADLAWQLHRFPTTSDADEVMAVAHEASAAIIRIDGLARELQVPECGAATWRPADWRTVAGRHADRPSTAQFHRELDRLCAGTFPEPSLLAGGTPLLDALIADTAARDVPSEDHNTRVIARLNTATGRPSGAARFVRDFSNELPSIRPSVSLEADYFALLAAFMGLDSAVPTALPEDPPPDVRQRVDAALDELQTTWDALRITC